MKDMLKKVVILDNIASPYVHQAIIVMRDYNPKLESQAVIEAERIVSAYLDDMKLKSRHAAAVRVRKRKPALFWICGAVLSAAAVIILKHFLF